jgi:hypothetical protein
MVEDGRKVENTPDYIRPTMGTMGTLNEIFRAEFQELVNEKYNDHTRIYTDG